MMLLLYVRANKKPEIAFRNILQEHSFSGYFHQMCTSSHKSHKEIPLNIVYICMRNSQKCCMNRSTAWIRDGICLKGPIFILTIQSHNAAETPTYFSLSESSSMWPELVLVKLPYNTVKKQADEPNIWVISSFSAHLMALLIVGHSPRANWGTQRSLH